MKKTLIIILMILFSFSLLSCNKINDSNTESNEETNNSQEQTKPGNNENNEDVKTNLEGNEGSEGKTEFIPDDGNGSTAVVEESSSITYLKSLFGENIDIYTNSDRNPYGIDLNKYGSNVTAYFYEPDFVNNLDPYINVDKTEFYNNYEKATSYEDAYYRSKHYLLSGDITDQVYLPTDGKITEEEKAVRLTDATYVLDADGNYLAYIPNVIDGDNYIIFYGAAYISLNEIGAYLLAFGSVPANQISKKGSSGQSQAISLWGKYGRVNDSEFYGNTGKYPYEPDLPTNDVVLYHEIDFGTVGEYATGYGQQTTYNNGSKITRGAARLVYVADKNVTKIEERFVFYTYNHYNDFQEYLNYHNGWGVRFGNESAGNPYCSSSSDYYNNNCVPPTQYSEVLIKKYSEII